MRRITNVNGSRVGYIRFELSDNESSPVWRLNIRPGLPLGGGYRLTATTDDDVALFARINGSGDPFVDLAASPIDLSGFPPDEDILFDFKAVAGSPLIDVRRAALEIQLTNQGI
jgi:hypothetical protein